jgi:hypothetical protein
LEFKAVTGEIALPAVESQEILKVIISQTTEEFPGIEIKTQVLSRTLTADNILLSLAIRAGLEVLYDVVKKIVSKLSQKGLSLELNYESRQLLAESFLQKNKVKAAKLISKTDHPDASSYVFQTAARRKHRLVIHSDGACDYTLENHK